MTVTRKMQDMYNEMESLELKPNEQSIMQPQSPPLSEWALIIMQMAQDKRHDLAAGTLRLWTQKLKKFRDSTICKALLAGKWEFFPSVDQVIVEIERIQAEPNNFVSCHECVNGWKTIEVDCDNYKSGKTTKAVRCQCWREWMATQ